MSEAHAIGHACRHLFQDFIAGRMAQTVVDVLEIVEVEIGDRHLAAVASRLVERLGHALLEEGAVRQSRQVIVMRHEVDTLVTSLALDGDARDVGG
jgi:hypothetical protein